MMDANELLRKLKLSDGAQIAELQRILQSGQGRQMAGNVDAATARRIERAAKAAQAGDKRAAQQALNEILATPEGAALAAQLKRLMGK